MTARPAPLPRCRAGRTARSTRLELAAGRLPAAVRGPPRAQRRRHAHHQHQREHGGRARSPSSQRQAHQPTTASRSPIVAGLPGKSFQGAALARQFVEQVRRQGRRRQQQRFHRHDHGDRDRGAAQRQSAGQRREADRHQPGLGVHPLLRRGESGHRHRRQHRVTRRRSPTRASNTARNGYIDEAQTMGWLARFFLTSCRSERHECTREQTDDDGLATGR